MEVAAWLQERDISGSVQALRDNDFGVFGSRAMATSSVVA